VIVGKDVVQLEDLTAIFLITGDDFFQRMDPAPAADSRMASSRRQWQ